MTRCGYFAKVCRTLLFFEPKWEEDVMTWEDIEEREDVVGGYFEFHEDGRVLIGPISHVFRRKGSVSIHLTWTAYRPEGDAAKPWRLTLPGVISFREDDATPFVVDQTKISTVIPWLGMTTLYLKGSMEIDPSTIRSSRF